MASYKVAQGHRVSHDDVIYHGGETVEGLSKAQVDALLADGAIVSSSTRAAPVKAEDKSEG